MSHYTPPLDDMLFTLYEIVGAGELPEMQEGGDLDRATVEAVLGEGGRFAADILAPLNRSGDQEGCCLADGAVTTPKGFKDAYAQFCAGGWNAVPFDPAYGGQGLPWTLTFALQELWQGANMAFGLCPLLTQAGVEALHAYGTEEQKDTYLAKLISGEWTGTMQLTESQAGTDLGALRCKAERQDDGRYKLTGQKIYITYGEHDWTGNIIHMVLARLPDAPEGYKGISMFLVPKFIPDENGNPGARNDAYATGLEHKLGIHASPTCTMQYGDQGGATGYLIGRENEGLKNMFIMMNNARLCVGLQGVALAERAYQQALAYAQERVQGTRIDRKDGARVAIIEHPDVKRMLLLMQAQIAAGRAIAYEAGVAFDRAKAGDKAAHKKVDLLTPIVKAWCTDMANTVAALGVQVHGGMGFIEETGAAQYVRDARILTIYEGTNGVQAQDLLVQKLHRDDGAAMCAYMQEMAATAALLDGDETLGDLAPPLHSALEALTQATDHMLSADLYEAAAVSVPYLKLCGTAAGGALLARGALAGRPACARLYMTHIMPVCAGLRDTVLTGGTAVAQANAA